MRAVSLVVLLLAAPAPAPAAAQASRDTTTRPARSDSLPPPPTALVREVFSYDGGGRDPFISLLVSGDVRPLIADLRLVTIVYDQRYAGRSVAILRDITNGKRYRVKPGEVIGRLKVTQIRPREVVFTVQEFGFERQETLQLKREETP